jgi:hypothetical protein
MSGRALVKDESRQGGKQTWWLRGRTTRDGLDLTTLHLIVEQISRAIETLLDRIVRVTSFLC